VDAVLREKLYARARMLVCGVRLRTHWRTSLGASAQAAAAKTLTQIAQMPQMNADFGLCNARTPKSLTQICTDFTQICADSIQMKSAAISVESA